MAKRIKIGDVVEIPTAKGLSYAQVTHRVKSWGPLLRVIEGSFGERPEQLGPVVAGPEQFSVFFPLQAAVNQGIFEVVGNEALTEQAARFPLFRLEGHIDRDGRVHDWYLWDGKKEWKVGSLTAEQRKLPLLCVINDTLLIEWIEQDWKPEKDRR